MLYRRYGAQTREGYIAMTKRWNADGLLKEIRMSAVGGDPYKHILAAELAELHRRIDAGVFPLPIPDDIAILLMEDAANGDVSSA